MITYDEIYLTEVEIEDCAAFHRANRDLVSEYNPTHPTLIFISIVEAKVLLAPFYKYAHRRGQGWLQDRLNFHAAREQEGQKVACHCVFIVEGPDGGYYWPPFQTLILPTKKTEHRLDCGAAYEARLAEEERQWQFQGTF